MTGMKSFKRQTPDFILLLASAFSTTCVSAIQISFFLLGVLYVEAGLQSLAWRVSILLLENLES